MKWLRYEPCTRENAGLLLLTTPTSFQTPGSAGRSAEHLLRRKGRWRMRKEKNSRNGEVGGISSSRRCGRGRKPDDYF